MIYGILDQPLGKDELEGRSDIPQTLEEFMTQMKEGGYDAKTFAIKLREMVPFCIFPLFQTNAEATVFQVQVST